MKEAVVVAMGRSAIGKAPRGTLRYTRPEDLATQTLRGILKKAPGCKAIAKFVGFAVVGVPPEIMGIGPLYAIPKAPERFGFGPDDIDLYELNEAFASQTVACAKGLDLDPEKVNVNGGAIATGHPLGCTGAALTVKLLHELRRREKKRGIVSMCIGSGMGAAGIFELL
jgi:acetyl-CoA acyltransferase